MHSTDFVWLSDEALIRWLTTYDLRPNLMIVVHGLPVEAVAARLSTVWAQPVLPSVLPGALRLPAVGHGTVLLQNVTELSRPQQIRLNDWIADGDGDAQIVSIARTPLWSLVQDGDFLEALYYRLNVVQLDATPESFAAGSEQSAEHRESSRA